MLRAAGPARRPAPLHRPDRASPTTDRSELLVDWRAPAAEPFYQATAARPLGVVAPPPAVHRRTDGDRRPGRGARPGGVRGARRRRQPRRAGRGGAVRQPRRRAQRPDARHRRDDPGRPGPRDPRAAGRGAGRAGRPGHRQDGGGAAPHRLPALREPRAHRPLGRAARRPEPGVPAATSSRCCRPSARPTRWSWRRPGSCSPGSRPTLVDEPRRGRAQGRPADGRGDRRRRARARSARSTARAASTSTARSSRSSRRPSARPATGPGGRARRTTRPGSASSARSCAACCASSPRPAAPSSIPRRAPT